MLPDDHYPPIGVPEIDAEHRELAAALESLFADATRATAASAADLLRIFADHFAHEERLMAEIGYPDLARHRRAHDHFLEDAREELDALPAGASAVGWLKRTDRWLRSHVINEDLWLGLALNDARHGSTNRRKH